MDLRNFRSSMEFNVFYTTNLPRFVLEDHKACCKKFGISVKYFPHESSGDISKIHKAHGVFINQLLEKASNSDVVCILDIDCLPHSLSDLTTAYNWVNENQSFIGNAQNISHTTKRNRIFAAASMLMIHKKAWLELGKPDLSFSKDEIEDTLVDTAQRISLVADELGFPYRVLLPLGYDDISSSWQLGPLCSYGKGTTYPGTWHFFRISDLKNNKPEIWERRVNEILHGKSIEPIYSSLNNYFERFQPFKKRLLNRVKNAVKKKFNFTKNY
jgi:hypothetical protein